MSGEVKMKRRDRTVFRAAALAAFLLIMSTVILLSVRADLDYGRNRLSRVVEYVAKRCDAYSLSSTASETRSLMRVMEAAKQAARDIRFLADPVDEDLLRGLSVDHYLSGILLLDRDGHITASYMAGADVTALLMPELEKDALLSAADFPRKVYAARIHCPDSSYIDMAAYGRLDAAGTVVVYYTTPTAYAKSYGLAFPDLREIYLLEQDGTIVVADGTTVVAANDNSLIGRRAEDIFLLRELGAQGRTGEMLTVPGDDGISLHRSLGMVEIGEYYKDDLDRQADCRQKIRESSRLLMELVNEVLDMGKLESGEIVLEERPFDLVALLDSVAMLLEQSAAARSIRVDRRPREVRHTALVGSPVHLKRLLMNIYSNAVRYNRDNGSITALCRELRTEGDTAWFEFICADTGIGMSESFQKHLFEPFAQEHSTARSTYGGTGLGMPIAKALVDRMGGSITFTSKVGEGTTFRITLPFRMDESAALPRQETAPDMAGALRGMRVLLAEDNDLNMEIAEFMLQSAGAEVTEARDGREAVELFRALPTGYFDAVLMDVMMPVLDGYQATGIIRASERPDAGVPVIAMTANAFVEDRQRAREAGMTEHLPKPLDQAVLVQTLQRWKKE